MDLSVFFAGTGGSVPTARRGLPALLVRRGGLQLLFDCGEGTQRQLLRSVGLPDIDRVFLTHLHTDHWLGVLGMLKSFDLRDRETPLTLYGPRGTEHLMAAMRIVYGRPSYPFTVEEIVPGDRIPIGDLSITALDVSHRGPALGYALVEDERPGHLDAELAQRLGVAFGPDMGRLQRGEAVDGVSPEQVMGPTRAGRKIVISVDTQPCEMVSIAAHRADLLVHESTFLHQDAKRAAMTGHSTARQAAELARDADVALLALTHLSTRYFGHEIRDEAREVFAATEVPRDFDTIEVPFAEKGAPELARWAPPPREPATPAPGAS